jgi:hypothetical protein
VVGHLKDETYQDELNALRLKIDATLVEVFGPEFSHRIPSLQIGKERRSRFRLLLTASHIAPSAILLPTELPQAMN